MRAPGVPCARVCGGGEGHGVEDGGVFEGGARVAQDVGDVGLGGGVVAAARRRCFRRGGPAFESAGGGVVAAAEPGREAVAEAETAGGEALSRAGAVAVAEGGGEGCGRQGREERVEGVGGEGEDWSDEGVFRGEGEAEAEDGGGVGAWWRCCQRGGWLVWPGRSHLCGRRGPHARGRARLA